MVDALERSRVEGALERLPRPTGLARAISSAFVLYRVVTRAPEAREAIDYRGVGTKPAGTLANPDVLQRADELGLRFVGVYAYLGLLGWIPREGWVTDDGAIRVSARRGKAGGLEGAMSSYYLSTTFDDGSALLTWAKSPAPLASTDRVESFGGTGDLAEDLASHRQGIARRTANAPKLRPIVVASVDDCVALSRFYDRFLTTDVQLSSIIKLRVFAWGGLAAIAAGALWALARLALH